MAKGKYFNAILTIILYAGSRPVWTVNRYICEQSISDCWKKVHRRRAYSTSDYNYI